MAVKRHSFYTVTERRWPNDRLKKGAIVGHTTTNSSRLWFRTGDPGSYRVVWYEEPGGEQDPVFDSFQSDSYDIDNTPENVSKTDPFETGFDSDTTVVLDIDSLKTDTTYRYALYCESKNNIVLGHDRPYSFRTMPDGDAPICFGFYSCHMPYKVNLFGKVELKNIDMWDLFEKVLASYRDKGLRFVIGGGDQAYCDGVKKLSIWKYLDKYMYKNRSTGEITPGREDMVSWYRNIYRGYWGFPALKRVFSSYPMYMMWDDHELGDGTGSYYKKEIKNLRLLPRLKDKMMTLEDGLKLMDSMKDAGTQVYNEYQHSHNPSTENGRWDFHNYVGNCAIYMLDGRGCRDVNRSSYRILGKEQMDRFSAWLDMEETKAKKYIFVVSAVPMFHFQAFVATKQTTDLFEHELSDDLRDSWEHELHDDERRELSELLFKAADRGQKVSILSGDVHMAAAYKLRNKAGSVVYQLTSSAITFNISRVAGWVLSQTTIPSHGTTKEGYTFDKIASDTKSNFSVIEIDPAISVPVFNLYRMQTVKPPDNYPEGKPPQSLVTTPYLSLPLDFI